MPSQQITLSPILKIINHQSLNTFNPTPNHISGGLIYGLLRYDNDKDALEFATAASCLKHTIKGDYNCVTLEEINNLVNGSKSGRVQR